MTKEELEQIREIEENLTAIADWCVQENKKLDKLINREVEGK